MRHWGWRPLVFGLFISILVVGCNVATNNPSTSASPSAYPFVTLTVGRLPTAQVSPPPTRAAPTVSPSPTPETYVVQSGDTLASVAARFNLSIAALQSANGTLTTLTPGQTLLIPAQAPLPLQVQAPTCYETHPGILLCLGRVENPLDFPAENVSVEVSLRHADGSLVQSQRTTLEQSIIPPGGFAPYQATFAAAPNDFSSASADLISAAQASDTDYLILLIENVQGQRVDGQWSISAIIDNPNLQDAQLVRAIVTLLDSLGRVIGYRVLTFDSGTILDAGAQLPLNLAVTPEVTGVTPEYNVYVEAHPVATAEATEIIR
ncbi:MAG TPA: LysM peptidoglycan-binding domain-containing protein [Phototrophicaceae bacterium]|nr:LysM peptidoglycan-binding domain-containing protein [Phototrophicaceae bacterium]